MLKILKKIFVYALSSLLSTGDDIQHSKECVSGNKRELLLGRLPQWSRLESQKPRYKTHRMNRFLKGNSKRIRLAINDGNFEKATLIWILMLKTSFSYQLMLFHRCTKGGYGNKSKETVFNVLAETINKLRAFNLNLTISRFYILKKNGKGRPIGAPNIESKIIAKAFNDLLVATMDTMIPPWQHGFRPNKGISSAIMDIVEQVYSQPDCSIFEFDLKGGFNNVKGGPTCKLLEKRSKLLAHTLSILLTQLRYRITGDLKDETELYQDTVPVEVRSKNKTRLLPLILRKGMPQGLPFSPVLSSIALSGTKPPKGLVMYADDGVMIVRGKEHFSQFERGTERIFTIGAYIAPEKSKFVNLRAGETFKFLGVTLDLMAGKLHYQGATFHFLKELNMEKNMIRLDNWLRAQNVTYADRINNASKGKPGYGYIREDSVAKAVFQPGKPSIMFEKAYTYIVGILFDRSYKGYRFFYGDPIAPSTSWGIYDVLSLSSDSIGYIVDHKSELKLKKRRPLNIEVGDLSEFFQSQMVPKKGYVDIWDGNMPMHLAADEYVEEGYNQLEGFRAD